jgi:uncharacterized protein YkwD
MAATSSRARRDWQDAAAATLRRFINEARSSRGYDRLAPANHLTGTAFAYARRLRDAGELSHTLDGRPEDRVAPYRCAGENLARVPATGGVESSMGRVRQEWLESLPHRSNALAERFRYDGVGAVRDGDDAIVVQLYARHTPPE